MTEMKLIDVIKESELEITLYATEEPDGRILINEVVSPVGEEWNTHYVCVPSGRRCACLRRAYCSDRRIIDPPEIDVWVTF